MEKKEFSGVLFGFLLIWCLSANGQPANDHCSTATLLCPGVSTAASNAAATADCGGSDADCSSSGTWGQCYDVNNPVWFSFMSNSSGGNVQVDVSGISCLNQTGTNILQGLLLEATVPCDTLTYTTLDCHTGSSSGFSLSGSGLAPNTMYWIHIDGSGSVSNAECIFNIEVSGTAVNWEYSSAVTDVTCNGGDDGSVAITVLSGISPYDFLWSNGQNGSTATGLAAGNYTVTISDAASCDTTVTVSVNEPPPITPSTFDNNSTCGNSDGSALVTPSTGFDYLWDNGQTNSTATALAAGVYHVTLTDGDGCTATAIARINDDNGPALTLSTSHVTCFGGSDGSAALNVAGGTPPYTYSWGPPAGSQTTQNASGLSAGTHEIIVTDSNGCKTARLVPINEPDEIQINFTVFHEQCGSGNGEATASANGGTGSFSFQWSNGQSGNNATGLSSGSYTVTATDDNGCTQTNAVFIDNLEELQAVAGNTPVTCNGGSDGQATAAALSGTAPFSYLWNNGQNNNPATALSAGIYTVTVTDDPGCTTAVMVTVTEPPPIDLTITTNDANCGSADGDATAAASDGESPYSFIWESGQTSATISGLGAGSYEVTVTDNKGCTQTGTAVISETGAPTVSTSSTNISCFGANDGLASASGSGGTPGYDYVWSNGSSAAIISNLGPGTYTVSVTDASGSGCVGVASVEITEPPPFTINTFTSDPGCGLSDGSANANVSGSTGSYTYNWSDGQTTATATGLPEGTYALTITSGPCDTLIELTLTEPDFASTITIGSTETGCGQASGTATASVSGSDNPYTYFWSNGQTDATANNLATGSYDVTVTDNNSCTGVESVSIIETLAVTATDISGTDASCGQSDGSAEVISVSGGDPAYSFAWSDGQIGSSATGLATGTYELTITDANSCTYTESIAINDKSSIQQVHFNTQDASCNNDDGLIRIDSVKGGNPSFQYSLDNVNYQSTSTFSDLAPGSYVIHVSDSSNCPVYDTTTVINQPQPPIAEVSGSSAGCSGTSGTITATVESGGTAPFLYSLNGGTAVLTGTFDNLAPGAYVVTIIDDLGCEITAPATITEEECELPPIGPIAKAFSPNDDGIADAWNISNLHLYENSRVFIYNRWGQKVFHSKGYPSPWDGTSLGYPVPAATYFYVIYLDREDKEAEVLKGTVGIAR